MDEDLSVKWELANPLTWQRDEKGEAWNAGAARDIAALDENRVLVATDTGGIWIAQRDGIAVPVADVDQPDFWCIAAGTYGNDHFFAAGRRLYESDTSQVLPLLNWREIPVIWHTLEADGISRPQSANLIYRILVLREDRKIVLATSNGIVWADIPPPPKRSAGCLAGIFGGGGTSTPPAYKWKAAVGLEGREFLGIAPGPPLGGQINRSIAVASWGQGSAVGMSFGEMQFYYGEWQSGDLVMQKSKMNTVGGIDRSKARATTMASCDADARHMYAVSSNQSGFVEMMWKSTDAGKTWDPFVPKLASPSDKSFAEAAGNLGNSGRPCNCIAVSRTIPETVAVGWRFQGFFISQDGGKNWWRTDTEDSPHVHCDVHAIYFDPTDPEEERIFIAHDGGISMAPKLGRNPKLFESMHNRQLANFQFQSCPSRMFFGGAAANPTPFSGGALIGGLQDNGVVACATQPAVTPWIQAIGGDGFQATFMANGNALFNVNDETGVQIGIVRHAEWDPAAKQLLPSAPVPVAKDDPTMPYPAGLPYQVTQNRDPHPVVFFPVRAAVWTNAQREPMLAVAGKRSSIYGLFYPAGGTQPRWEFLARFPLNDLLSEDDINAKNWEPWGITAIASFDGTIIYIGTNGGRIIAFDQTNRVAEEISVPFRTHPAGDMYAEVNRIVVAHDGLAFAAYKNFVLRIRPPKAEVLKGLPQESYYGLEVVRERQQDLGLYAATDSSVYVSRDPGDSLGDTWMRASRGLPKRPHCGDLSYGSVGGEPWLYLSTYGRSFWRARR